MSAVHGHCGGKILEALRFETLKLPCAVRSRLHDLPLLQGDSGAPVFTRDGRLVGTNVLQKGNLTASAESHAVRPDRRWIRSLSAGTK